MDSTRNPNGGGMSSVSGRVQRGPTTMANASATYVPGPTTMANARATYVPGPTTMANARAAYVPNFKETLDRIVSDYTNTATDKVGFANRMGAQVTEPAPGTGLDQLLGMMYETSGGANYATIKQLEAQRLAAQQNYKTNRADAQNLYGVLSMDAAAPSTGLIGEIESMGKRLQGAYTGAIDESLAQAEGRRASLSQEGEKQRADRVRALAELGLSEVVGQNFASDEALNKSIGDIAASAGSWENLLRSQQGSAAERTNRMITAAGNTKNQTLLGMKALLDQQQAQLNAAISAERSKTPTQKLTDVGRILQKAMNEQVLKDSQSRFPDIFGTPEQKLNRGAQAQQEVMTNWGIKSVNEYNMILNNAYAKNQARSAGDNTKATELSPTEAAVLASLNIPQYLMD